MSRIGKKPIDIPAGVKVTVADGNVLVEGKEKLSMALPPHVTAVVSENQVLVSAADESRKANAMHGLARSLIQNMVIGVSACGKRVMTSSSSPGISLKSEGISYLAKGFGCGCFFLFGCG